MLLCAKRSLIDGRWASRKAIRGRNIHNNDFVGVI